MKDGGLRKVAEGLINNLDRFHVTEHSHPSDRETAWKIQQKLEGTGLIGRRQSKRKRYVIRHQVHGSPLILDTDYNEIIIRSRAFADACLDVFLEKGSRASLLEVIR